MYVPRHFSFPDGALSDLHDLIEGRTFGLLVTYGEGGLDAVHLPFALDRQRGPYGTLGAHVARANPVWERLAAGEEVLAVFRGAHTYVSPDWYADPKLVPTWNYVAVHTYGVPQLIDDPNEVVRHLQALSANMEETLLPKRPWTVDKLPPKVLKALMNGLVAFDLEITRIEGKQKLNQNRSCDDRAGVIAALTGAGDPDRREIAELMEAIDT